MVDLFGRHVEHPVLAMLAGALPARRIQGVQHGQVLVAELL